MKKIIDKVLSVKLFAICYLAYLAINLVSVINPQPITRIFLALFAAWGLAICANTYIFGGKHAWTDKWMAVLMAFLAVCLVTELLNFRYGGVRVIGELCFFALCILVLYSQYKQSAEDYKKTMGIIARVLGVVIGVLMAVSDYMFIDIYKGVIEGRNGQLIKVGFAENRLYGVFSSPNVGGFYALVLIWCAVIVLLWAKDMKFKGLWRTLAGIEIVLAVMYISVALSRGTYVSGIVLLVAYLIIRAPFRFEQGFKAWQHAAVRAISLVAAVAICFGGIFAVNKASVAVMKANFDRKVAAGEIENIDELQAIIDNAELGSDGRVEAGRDDIDITNKRSAYWKANLGLLKGIHLFIGVNDPVIYAEQNDWVPSEQESTVKFSTGNLHNGFFQIIVNCGLLALIPMLIWLALCVINVIKRLIAACKGKFDTSSSAYAVFSLALPMVLAVLMNNVFETNFVLMGANFIQAIFWFAAGACVMSLKAKQEQKEQGELE